MTSNEAMRKNAEMINALFAEALGDPEEIDNLAMAGGEFIRKRLRELSFLRKIVPPTEVKKGESKCRPGLVDLIDNPDKYNNVSFFGSKKEGD